MIDPRFVFLGALLSMAGSSTYVYAVLIGTARPNRVTWMCWACLSLIAFAAQLHEGVGLPAVMTLAVGFGPAAIVVASFVNKQSYWALTKLDITCGVMASLAISFWLVLDNANLAILMVIVADAVGAVPTIVKAWSHPGTERSTYYVLAALNGVITLLTIQTWSFAASALPVYIAGIGLLLAILVRLRGRAEITSKSAVFTHAERE